MRPLSSAFGPNRMAELECWVRRPLATADRTNNSLFLSYAGRDQHAAATGLISIGLRGLWQGKWMVSARRI
jgi:hypothetical protein